MCRLLQKTRKRSGPRAAVRLDRQCYIAAASKVSYDRRMGMMGLLYDRRMRSVDIDCRATGICSGFNELGGRHPVDALAHILDPLLE
jgi:hypothetical protein